MINTLIDKFRIIIDKKGVEFLIINIIVCLGIYLIYLRVFKNFLDARKQKDKQQKEVKSIVETGSMTAFFIICYIVIMLHVGTFKFHDTILNIIALLIYITGIAFNLLGRHYLGKNWGNNVVIYKDHTLITNGVYKIVRHPLYASIIWCIYALGILYQNYLIFILNTFVFIPSMTYRAKQEEKELTKTFKEYEEYKKKTGMFFPKIRIKEK